MEDMHFISCIRFSIQLMLLESFFVLGWNRKKKFGLHLAIGIGGYILMAFLLFWMFTAIPGYHPIVYTAYYIGLFALSLGVMKTCFWVKAKEVLFAGVCGYASQHIAFAVSMIIQEMTGLSLPAAWDYIVFRFLPYLLVGLLIYAALIRRYEGKGELKEKDIRMILLAFVILFTTVYLSVLVDSNLFQQESSLMKNVLCKFYALICCTLSIFIAFNLSRQNRIMHENEMMENMLHSMKEQQKLSKENINIINIKCHDLKYRISKIPRIEDAQNQQEYIASIRDAVAIYDNIYQTGNDALDLVLTEKSLLCEKYHIKMSCMIEGSAVSFMNTTDLYALFGNLLDNAMESVLKEEDEEKRIVSIQVARRNQGCHIHMENHCCQEPVFEDGLPLTTKEDKAYHGFGVKSIRYLVDKYKGDILMQAAEGRFSVDIFFYHSADTSFTR